ncbi:MAG: PQQ-dependent sugar dehydrogenase [Luteolibacter sp.]
MKSNPAHGGSGFLKLLRWSIAGVLLLWASVVAGVPGLDGPAAIGPFLNGALPTVEPTGASEWTVQETFTGININLPMHILPYPGTNKLLCVAKEGKIFLFDNTPGTTQTDTFLDLSSVVFTSSDSGMTWLVFHPEFGQVGSPNRDFVYITYKWKPSGGNGNEAYWRLARFSVISDINGKPVADPASEQILIQQYDQQQWHDSGGMTFGPGGYLYVGIGDEGGSNDQYNDAQKINDRLFSGILRIDVDQKAGSHAIRRQPLHHPAMPAGWPESFTANYKIPADNPFNDVSGGNLEEFYAIGVRQPYRFSYDIVSNRLWLAESGQDTREELDIVTAGLNFGWPFREGKISRPTGPQPPAVPANMIGTLTEPIWDATHATDGCTVGGFVYRGSAHPALVGKFITVDNVTGHVRAHTYDGTTATNELLTDMPSGSVYSGTSTIGWDQSGEPIFVKINGTGTRGRYFKLATIPSATTRVGWFRFEDQATSNTSGYVADNPGNNTSNSVARGVSLVANDDETNASTNVTYNAGSGLSPTGFPANTEGVHIATGDTDGRPGNQNGELATSAKLGVLDDFTIELSFRPLTLATGTYQCFIGLDGMTGTTPAADGEDGPTLQPFRLMRFGRTDSTTTLFPITNGDLFLNVRTLNPTTGVWTTVPLKVLPKASFLVNDWYHLAIVGNVTAGTITVYRYNSMTSSYTQLGQATGYVGNLQAGTWTVGRGCFGGVPADWVDSTDFDEVRITDSALPQSKFLYGSQPVLSVIPVVDPPPLLSQTGAFSNLANLTPAQGVVPYGVNAPLWSDGAAKQRWMALPNDGVHNSPSEKITFKPEGNWKFPPGTVFIKHFELPVDDSNPSVHRRLETRFVVIPTTGEPFGFTYKWRADNSDADLLPAGLDEQIDIATPSGGTRQATWTYPSRGDCRVCHNGNADYVLGVNTQQLNGAFNYPLTGRTAYQLETLGSIGWFDTTYRADLVPWMLKSHNVAETTASLTDRVRSYIDSNCSQCHRPGGVRAFFDARLTTPIEDQGLIYGDVETSYGDELNRVIRPGDPSRSIMLLRLGSTAEIKMPPIAKHIVDQPAVQLLTDWINSLATGPSVALSTPSSASGPFTVNVHFSQNVTGLTADDFQITGGQSTGLTGSGADYVLSITPASATVVTVKLPESTAVNAANLGNYASKLFSQNVADPTIVAWLKLDDASGTVAADSVGSNSGTLVNMGASPWIAGKFGGGLVFDATDQHVNLPNVVGADFSISFWMKSTQTFPRTDTAPAGASICNADLSGAANDFVIAGTRSAGGLNRITFQTGKTGTNNVALHGITAVNGGTWNHVVVTRAQVTGQMKIFVNGALESSVNGNNALVNGNPVISIGATPGNAAASYTGSLDEIRLFSRVLTAGEIVALGTGPAPVPPYDQWVRSWLPGIYHLQGMGQDIEGDGATNFAEYAFDGNPLASDVIPVPLSVAADGSVTLSYIAHKVPRGAVYQVRVTGDLVNWSPADPDITQTTSQAIPASDYEWITVTYVPPAGAGPARFFRVDAVAQ